MKIILASKSRDRKKALDIIGLKYSVKPSNFDEKSIRNKSPKKLALLLAKAKALTFKDEKNAIIISGDLFIVFKNKIYEKPTTKKQAFNMLKGFSGKIVKIIASTVVLNTKTKRILSSVDTHKMKFRKLTDYEIKNYISNNPVMDFSAGFDGNGQLRFGKSGTGSYAYMTALAIDKVIEFLRKNNINV